MSVETEAHPKIMLAGDRMTADMLIPPEFDREQLNEALCIGLLQQAGVQLTADVKDRLARILNNKQYLNPGDPPQPLTFNLAKGQPPTHGRDGTVEWHVTEEPIELTEEAAKQIDHYERCPFIIVEKDQHVATLHPPQSGIDGRDVTGRNKPANEGRPCAVEPDDTLQLDARHRLFATVGGVLVREGNRVTVSNRLEIPENVDFATGNLNFGGDIHVRNAIRDLFIVKTRGNLEVHGLIGAAHIETKGDLIAKGGIAGREIATAKVHGNLHARYIDSANVEVHHDLIVDREVINARMLIHGNVLAEKASLIGGESVMVQNVHLATVGSDGEVPTYVTLGSVPNLEPFVRELDAIHELVKQIEHVLNEEMATLGKPGKRQTSIDRERQTRIMFDQARVLDILGKVEPTREHLNGMIEDKRTCNLRVDNTLHVNTRIHFGDDYFRIHTPLKGPVYIGRLKDGRLGYGPAKDDLEPITNIADMSCKA